MKKWMTLILASAITLSLVGCQEKTQTNQPVGEQMPLEKVYTNSVDRYQLTLPTAWTEVKIVEDGRSTDFIFPSEQPDANQSIMRIVAMTEEEWKAVEAEGGPAMEQFNEITQRDGSRYFYLTPLDQILSGDELAEYEVMVQQIPMVIASFQF